MMTRAAQTHQAGHMGPAGRVFETPGLIGLEGFFGVAGSPTCYYITLVVRQSACPRLQGWEYPRPNVNTPLLPCGSSEQTVCIASPAPHGGTLGLPQTAGLGVSHADHYVNHLFVPNCLIVSLPIQYHSICTKWLG